MADRAGGGTSLRGMRERMVAAAHAIAAERRSHSTVHLQQQQAAAAAAAAAGVKSTCKPILDGSVLKNDEKQRLAKERREEKRRRDDASKEIQLLEKERKAKIYHEKQIEEKQRKLKEQKERDEQRRISVEEKRKQKLEEEQERYKAVLSRSVDRSTSRVDSKKRWSWEGPLIEGKSATESKDGKMGRRSSSLSRKYTQTHVSSDRSPLEGRPLGKDASLLSHLQIPGKSGITRSKSSASLPNTRKDNLGIHALVPHMAQSNRSQSSHELHSVIVIPSMTEPGTCDVSDHTPLSKSTKVLHNKSGRKAPRKSRGEEPVKRVLQPTFKVTIIPRVEVAPTSVKVAAPSVEVAPTSVQVAPASVQVAPKVSSALLPAIELGECSNADGHMISSAQGATCETDLANSTGVSTKSSLGDSLDTSPELSTESSAAFSVNPSPEVSIDSSEVSVDTSPEVSVEVLPEASVVDGPQNVKVEVLPEHPVELPCVPYEEQTNQLSEPDTERAVGPSSDMKIVQQNTEMASGQLTKKRLTSSIPYYTWPSLPSSGSRPPSPRINKLKCPPSPVMSKSQVQFSLAYKSTPVQRFLYVANAVTSAASSAERIKDVAPKPKSVSQDVGNKTTPGIVNKEEATKILSEKRRIVREQREKELQKDAAEEERKDNAALNKPSKSDEGQPQAPDDTNLQKCEGGQQELELAKTTENIELDDQKKGDAKIKAQEEADKRKKEHERIMFQNLKERLERKKRIEEIMKRTRKADWNPSKAAETMGKAKEADDEVEADDEESDSEKDLSDDANSLASLSSEESSLKPQVHFRKTKKPTKLVFLDPTSTQLRPGTTVFLDDDVKSTKPVSNKRAVAVTEDARTLSKRATAIKSNKSKSLEANKSLEPSKSSLSSGQEWYCSTVIDMSSDAESLLRHAAHIKKYNPRGSLPDEKSTAQSDK